MTYVSLSEFLAEIETIFQNYADSNDIDRISVKGWVIDKLRIFGKNICDQREAVIGIQNSGALLPANFKSLSLALKLEGDFSERPDSVRVVPVRQYITNDVQWDSPSQTYVKNNYQSQLIVESIIENREPLEKYFDAYPLSLVKGFQKSAVDMNCYNLSPKIRGNYYDKISITNRSIQTNFKTGLIYIQYNSLPEIDGEIAIPIISTSDIYRFIINYCKIQIAENLIINNKNPNPGLQNLMQLWMQQDRAFFIAAKSEANWYGLNKGWELRYRKKMDENLQRFNLPKF